jgi:hypothetical protein
MRAVAFQQSLPIDAVSSLIDLDRSPRAGISWSR